MNLFFSRLLVVAGVLTFFSCSKTIEPNPNPRQHVTGTQTRTVQLGKNLKNPYSVSNMKLAYVNLAKSQKRLSNDPAFVIKATHFYVKFMPGKLEDLSILKLDSTLDLYPYPLDVELPYESVIQSNPDLETISKVQSGYWYASVPVGHPLPQIPYEILEELYIPDEEKITTGNVHTHRSASISLPGWLTPDALVERSLQMTGNDKENQVTVKGRRARRWIPAGRIRTLDDTPNINTLMGVEGIIVKARRWFTTHKGFTDANGNFSCDGTFKRPANYSFAWERHDFQINNSAGSLARIDGPKQKGNWNVDINFPSFDIYHATAFRAAFHYYYKDRKGLRTPPENGFWKTQLKIKVRYERDPDGSLGNHSPARRFLGLGSAIHLYCFGRNTRQIYATTIHEIAHASHWNMSNGGNYTKSESRVAESWARGVQWELTRMVYPGYEPDYFPIYTGIVQDMIDGVDGYDQVEGYTIRQIEDALLGRRTWIGWRENIKKRYENPAEANLDALFTHWQ